MLQRLTITTDEIARPKPLLEVAIQNEAKLLAPACSARATNCGSSSSASTLPQRCLSAGSARANCRKRLILSSGRARLRCCTFWKASSVRWPERGSLIDE